ncbi:DMT family transporter [Apilactobacillus xinyiensis]|uniref:DMT family transporter n=1 Tax=Apilactobacillus xinyiensis TaxID=2841032 RepID=UPI001C7CEB96|nr:DMT family transporter [Apilactobacillus xinyiensis]
MKVHKKAFGAFLAIFGSLLWGIQGPVSQYLFADNHLSPEWLMGVKMGISGILILLFTKFFKHENIFRIWHGKTNIMVFILYAVFGLSAVQYLYLVTVRASNAGTATILQSLGTIFIVILTVIIYKHAPSKYELTAVIVALIGTWFLVTKGYLTHLAITDVALTLGLLLAFSGAIQTMLPINLLKKFSSLLVVGWAMVIGGVIFTIIHPFWHDAPNFNLGTILGVSFIVLFGTMTSFLCFINSLKFISPTVAGLLNTFEPLSATLGTILFLNTDFNIYEIFGGILILSTVFILSLGARKSS